MGGRGGQPHFEDLRCRVRLGKAARLGVESTLRTPGRAKKIAGKVRKPKRNV